MSDLRPKGYRIEVGGVERNLLFTLNAIDAIQSEYDKNVLEVINEALNRKNLNRAKVLRKVMEILLNDEAEREEFFHPGTGLKPVTEKEAGWLIDMFNINDIEMAIVKAYAISMPDPDEDPNQKSGQQNN